MNDFFKMLLLLSLL